MPTTVRAIRPRAAFAAELSDLGVAAATAPAWSLLFSRLDLMLEAMLDVRDALIRAGLAVYDEPRDERGKGERS